METAVIGDAHVVPLLERLFMVNALGVEPLRAQAARIRVGRPLLDDDATQRWSGFRYGVLFPLSVCNPKGLGSGCVKPWPVHLQEIGRDDGAPRVVDCQVGRNDGLLQGLFCSYTDAPRSELPDPARCVAIVSATQRHGTGRVWAQHVSHVGFPGGRVLEPAPTEVWEWVEPADSKVAIGLVDGRVHSFSLDGTQLDEQGTRPVSQQQAAFEAWAGRAISLALHELPAGVLGGDLNGANVEECRWLRSLADAVAQQSRDLNQLPLMRYYEDAAWHFERWEHYLGRRQHFESYRQYVIDRQGPLALRAAHVPLRMREAVKGLNLDDIAALGQHEWARLSQP